MAIFDSGNYYDGSIISSGSGGTFSAQSINNIYSSITADHTNQLQANQQQYYNLQQQQMTYSVNPNAFYTYNTATWGGEIEPETFEIPEKDKSRVASAFDDLKKSVVPTEMVGEEKATKHATLLKELGFTKLGDKIKEVAEKAMKINMISLAGYAKIPADKLAAAKQKIEHKNDNSRKLYLLETTVEDYVGQNADEKNFTLPPTDVLEKLATAKKSELFDSFSILHVKAVPDPILLGRIKGEADAFFIAEWGDDIKLADIMA